MSSAAYATVDLADLTERLLARSDSVKFWTNQPQNLTDAINEALQVYGTLTGFWRGEIPQPLQPSSDPYVPLPASLFWPVTVTCLGRTLKRSSLLALDAVRRGWEGETVDDGGDIPTRPMIWAPAGLYLIAVWPQVTATNAYGLLVNGVQQTPQLVNPGDYIQLPDADISNILDEALHVLTLGLGGDTFALTTPLHQGFMAAAARGNERLASLQVFRQAIAADRGRQERVLDRDLPLTRDDAVALNRAAMAAKIARQNVES